MKKLLLAALVSVTLLTGCGSNTELNLSDIGNKLDTLNNGKFYLPTLEYGDLSVFEEELEDIYDLKKVNLDYDMLDAEANYIIKYNEDTEQLLIIVKASDEEEVKEALDSFTKDMDGVLKSNYEGYTIYINSDNNSLLLERIKNSKELVFGELMNIPVTSDDEFEITMNMELGLNPEDVEEFLMKKPMMMTQASTYIIVKPAEGKTETVESKINEYMEKQEQQWETYLPDQYELVKNRKAEKLGDYLIYIVSTDNELVFNTIKGE